MQVDFAIEQSVLPFGLGVRLPGLAIAAHGRTATRVPTRPVVDSLCCGKATREGALRYDLGTPFVNSSAPAEP